MKIEDIKRYSGKRVMIILTNNFRYTTRLPEEIGSSITIQDKYGKTVTVDCDMIRLITEVSN